MTRCCSRAGFAATGQARPLHPNICLVLRAGLSRSPARRSASPSAAAGPSLFQREDSRLFKRSYVDKAEEVVERYGAGNDRAGPLHPDRAHLPHPLVAGAATADRTFVTWNIVGGILWGTGVTLLGYYLGTVDVIGRTSRPSILDRRDLAPADRVEVLRARREHRTGPPAYGERELPRDVATD